MKEQNIDRPYFERGKKRGVFYVIKIEEFNSFYILHLKRKKKLYKTLSPKGKEAECYHIKLGEKYYFYIHPMLGVPKDMMLNAFYENVEYFDKTITMERDTLYVRNIYEIKNIKGICAP